jgi:hypothetical protein
MKRENNMQFQVQTYNGHKCAALVGGITYSESSLQGSLLVIKVEMSEDFIRVDILLYYILKRHAFIPQNGIRIIRVTRSSV